MAHAQPDRRRVRLVVQDQVAEQPGGPVDPDHQDPGGHRVQRAGVADLPGADQPAHPADDLVRGPAGRLVQDDQAGLSRWLLVAVIGVLLVVVLVRVGLAGVRRADRLLGHPGIPGAGLGQQVVDLSSRLRYGVQDEGRPSE